MKAINIPFRRRKDMGRGPERMMNKITDMKRMCNIDTVLNIKGGKNHGIRFLGKQLW